MNPTLKKSAFIALGTLGLLLVGAVIFFKERMLFIDSSYIVFNIINKNALSIQEHRIGSFITQSVPLLSARLHLPMKWILLSYSMSFYIFYLLVACILIFRNKQYGLAILMVMYFTIIVSDAYFWPNNEVHQGTAWMFLLIGYVLQQNDRKYPIIINILVVAILGTLALFTHFLVFISCSFLWFFFWIDGRYWPFPRRDSFILSAILIAVIVTKFHISTSANGYDNNQLNHVTNFSLHDVIKCFVSPHAKEMVPLFFTNYWIYIPICIAGLIVLLKQKKYLLAVLVIAYSFGFFIAICLTFSAFPREILFYMESEWMTFSIIGCTPFVFYALPRLRAPQAMYVMLVIFCIRLIYISISAPRFTSRLAFLDKVGQYMQQRKVSKLAILKSPATDHIMLMDWGVPVESIFLSSLHHDIPNKTCIMLSSSDTVTLPAKDMYQLPFRDNEKTTSLNAYYFHIDTTTAYSVVTFEEVQKYNK